MAGLNDQDAEGRTQLMLATIRGELERVEALVLLGAAVNVADNRMRTALYHAATLGHSGIVGYLLRQPGIDANAADLRGNSPSMAALMAGKEAAFRLLANCTGVDVTAQNDRGMTALGVGRSLSDRQEPSHPDQQYEW